MNASSNESSNESSYLNMCVRIFEIRLCVCTSMWLACFLARSPSLSASSFFLSFSLAFLFLLSRLLVRSHTL